MYKKEGETLLESLGGEKVEKVEKVELPTTFSPPSPGAKHQDVVEVEEIGVSSEEVDKAARFDLDFLAALIMPTIFEFCFPDVFKSAWAWLLDFASKPRTFPQLALGLPRGFGKTTLVKIFIIYCICTAALALSCT